MKRKEGISLIVLVITIVVIVILATAVILSIANNNPIGNASEAVEKNNRAEYESELSLYIAKQYADKNGEYDPTTLNKQANEVSEIITSLSEKDKDKYIIWQGELYKKEVENDKVVYKDKNGVTAKWLDEETEVTETRIEFLKAFNDKQDSLSEDDKLFYNGGYITGISYLENVTTFEKVETFKQKLPDSVVIYRANGETIAADTHKLTTGFKIKYNDEIVAIVVAFGDTDSSGSINLQDTNLLEAWIKGKNYNYKAEQIMSADVDHNGHLDADDLAVLQNTYNKNVPIDQKVKATYPN